jgi:hypothetical protein
LNSSLSKTFTAQLECATGENPEKYRAALDAYRASPSKKTADRKSYLKRTYGMTIEDFERLLETQRGVCAICKKARPENRTLHVDHDHKTGRVRGLLCFRCNNALGDFEEKYELFQLAADYLERDEVMSAKVRERVVALCG